MKQFLNELPQGEAASLEYQTSKRLTSLKSRRKRWLSVHLWFGLILGLFLAIFGITGSILVFYEEIDNIINADFRIVQVPFAREAASYRPYSEIQASAFAAMPPEASLGFVDYPSDETASYKFGFSVPASGSDANDEWQVHVNPYTGQVLDKHLIKNADELFPSAFIPFVFRLHFALLAGETGGIIVGIMGTMLLFSVLTGLIVWWPLNGRWRRALTIKRHASTERLNHDLHQTSGFYTFPILFAVLLSGVYMNLPEQFMALVKQLSPGTQGFMDNPHSAPSQGKSPIGLDKALEIVNANYPQGRIDWMSNPEEANGIYVISISDLPELSRFWSERQVFVDQYSGVILQVRDPSTRMTAGQTFVEWQWPLHSGRAFGWTGRILVFISGLACPLLFVTGLIRWLQKRKAKAHSHKNQTP